MNMVHARGPMLSLTTNCARIQSHPIVFLAFGRLEVIGMASALREQYISV